MSTDDTRTRILATAVELFSERGYEATSLREIADRLGFTKAALYYHFPSKAAIAIEMAAPLLERLEALVDGLDDPHGLLTAYVDVLLEHHDVVGIVSRDLSLLHDPEVGGRLEENTEAVRGVLGRDAAGDQRLLTSAALGTIWRPIVQLSSDDVAPRAELLVRAATTVLSLTTPAAASSS